MNLLILSAGTRCQLINYCKKVENGFDRVVATDCSMYAPAIYMADNYYIVPKMKKKEYIPTLFNICIRENIKVILPLQEDELEIIAQNREIFEKIGIFVCVSPLGTVKICRDKYLFYKKLKSVDVQCVETYDYETEREKIENLTLPLIMKERNGCGSIGNLVIKYLPMLECCAKNSEEKLIVQPYMEVQEFGVDVYVDFFSGEIISIFAKEKLRMRAGETEKSKSVKDEKLFELVKTIVEKLEFSGPIDIDILKCKDQYYVLEINPRFGGGYPHAYECGVNFIKYIVLNAMGKKLMPEIGCYKEDEVMLKYTDAMVMSKSKMELND